MFAPAVGVALALPLGVRTASGGIAYAAAQATALLSLALLGPGWLLLDLRRRSPGSKIRLSIFRDLIEDFGLTGSVCATALFGFFGRLSFAATIAGHLRALPWLVLVYGFAITSFASGLLSYTTPAVAVGVFILTFRLLPGIVEAEAALALTGDPGNAAPPGAMP